jgi:hypothetical protein
MVRRTISSDERASRASGSVARGEAQGAQRRERGNERPAASMGEAPGGMPFRCQSQTGNWYRVARIRFSRPTHAEY